MIKINQNSKSKFFKHEHEVQVLNYALKLAEAGQLRNILNSGKEIAYWYAPEVNKGKVQVSSNSTNEYKTVSIQNETKKELTDAEYSNFITEAKDLMNDEKIDDSDLFVILERTKDTAWNLSLNKKGIPYTYSTFDSAVRSAKRLLKAIKNEKNPTISALKIVKYNPQKIDFDKGQFIESFYALETSENKYLGITLTPVDSIDNAITFNGDSQGELDAQKVAQLYHAKVTYFEVRKLWQSK